MCEVSSFSLSQIDKRRASFLIMKELTPCYCHNKDMVAQIMEWMSWRVTHVKMSLFLKPSVSYSATHHFSFAILMVFYLLFNFLSFIFYLLSFLKKIVNIIANFVLGVLSARSSVWVAIFFLFFYFYFTLDNITNTNKY
jgi:hypothetical protein